MRTPGNRCLKRNTRAELVASQQYPPHRREAQCHLYINHGRNGLCGRRHLEEFEDIRSWVQQIREDRVLVVFGVSGVQQKQQFLQERSLQYGGYHPVPEAMARNATGFPSSQLPRNPAGHTCYKERRP